METTELTPRTEPTSITAQAARHPLTWIILGGVLVRVILWVAWLDWSPIVNDDARDYQGLAARLLTSGAYSSESGVLISLRPPLYPMLVAATYQFVGMNNDHAVQVVQSVIGLLTALLVYRIGSLTYSQRVGLWAAGLTCFYPSLLAYANLMLSETLFTFLSVAFAALLCEALHRHSLLILIGAGLVMGLAALTRSIMLPFLPICMLIVAFGWLGGITKRVTAAALLAAAFAVIITPWTIRNTRVQETFTVIDVMGGRNLMMGNYEHTPMERSWATISDVAPEHQWHRLLHHKYPSDSPRTQGQIDKLAMRYAIDFILANPWLTLKRDAVKFFNFWQLERELIAAAGSGHFGDTSPMTKLALAAIVCGSYAFVLLAAIYGVCCVPPSDWRYHWFLIASILFPCLIHTLVFGHARYHLPVIPLLTVYAAAAIVNIQAIWQSRWSKRFALASLLVLLVIFGWVRELVVVDFESIRELIG